jgi:hypothetical protein
MWVGVRGSSPLNQPAMAQRIVQTRFDDQQILSSPAIIAGRNVAKPYFRIAIRVVCPSASMCKDNALAMSRLKGAQELQST